VQLHSAKKALPSAALGKELSAYPFTTKASLPSVACRALGKELSAYPFTAKASLPSAACQTLVITCGDVWVLGIVRHNMPETFSIFLPQPLHAMTRHLDKFHDFRTPFAFYIIKKHFFNKLVVMFREEHVLNFTCVPSYGLKIHSET
jgi:hypothetical protein